jgi:hypothetical protein
MYTHVVTVPVVLLYDRNESGEIRVNIFIFSKNYLLVHFDIDDPHSRSKFS